MHELDRSSLEKLAGYVGDKTKLGTYVMKILSQTGHFYNTIRRAFTTPEIVAFDRATQSVGLL